MRLPVPAASGELPLDLPKGCRWAVALTHDMDHTGFRDHLRDLFLPGYALRLLADRLLHRFRPLAAADGLAGILLSLAGRDRWNGLPALLEAERACGVRSTWFVAVRRGRGIAYGRRQLAREVARLRAAGQEIGLHGQSADDAAGLAAEFDELRACVAAVDAELATGQPQGLPLRQSQVSGLRMHYLRLSAAVLDGLAAAGARYDSTVFERDRMAPDRHPLERPRLVRPGLLEIPLHVMDSTLFARSGLGLDGPGAIAYTRRLFARARERGRLVVVNLHTNTYSRQTPEIRAWYDDLLRQVTSAPDVFVTDMAGLVPRVRLP